MSHENKQLDIYAQVAAHHAKVGESAKPEDRIIGKAPELGMGFDTDTEAETCQHGRDYRTDGDGIWLRRGFLSGILRRTGEPLKKGRAAKLIELPELAAKVAGELEQAQATIKEMGELIDQQAAELTRLKGNVNYMVEGGTCARAEGIPREDV